jgi:multidrug resistance efflux pump
MPSDLEKQSMEDSDKEEPKQQMPLKWYENGRFLLPIALVMLIVLVAIGVVISLIGTNSPSSLPQSLDNT